MSGPSANAVEEVHRLTELADALRDEVDRRQAELSAAFLAMTRMHEASVLSQGHAQRELASALIDAIVAVQSADIASVHLFNPRTGHLDLVVDRGLPDDALPRAHGVPLDSLPAVDVLRRGQRVGLGSRELAATFGAEMGLVAGQMTPLLGAADELLGVITTGFRAPHEWRDRDLRFTDLFARQAADLFKCGRAAEALRRSHAYLAESERMSHTGSWSVEMPGNILFLSVEHYRIFGLEPGSAVTIAGVMAMIHPEDAAAVRGAWVRAVAQSGPFEASFRVVRRDGGVCHVRSAGHPVFDEAGLVTEYVGALVDETDRCAADNALALLREKLAHVGRVTAIGALTASIAHELNQPLAAIAANAQACMHWIAASPSNLEEASAAAQRIVRDAKRASDVVRHHLAFLLRGKRVQSAVSMADVIRDVAVLLAGDMRGKGVTLDCRFDRDLPEVTGDRVQLQQVVLNLVMNAIESVAALAQPRGQVWICVEREAAGAVLVSVRDNGIGLEPGSHERLFDDFYTTKPFGVGMGLLISRTIVEAHGGRLWAGPDTGARGATFSFTLAARAEAS